MYFNFFLNDDKGFPFYGVTLTYADSAVLNLAQLATWAEFKNVQNLHKSKVTPKKQTPLEDFQVFAYMDFFKLVTSNILGPIHKITFLGAD